MLKSMLHEIIELVLSYLSVSGEYGSRVLNVFSSPEHRRSWVL